MMRAGLAESYLIVGKTGTARSHLAAARRHCESYGENYLGAELCRLAALLSQAEAAPVEIIESHLNEALTVARGQEARLFELRAATSLAQLLGEQGRRAEARELLAPIYGWFTEGFDTPDLKEAKALLDALA